MTEIKIKFEFVDHDKVILTNQNGDTYTSKSEGLMDFLHSTKPESLPAPTQDGTAEEEIKCHICDGHGYTVEPECCRMNYGTGDMCCGCPDPVEVQCKNCKGYGIESSYAAPLRAEIERLKLEEITNSTDLQTQYDRIKYLHSELTAANQRVKDLEDTILWALGYIGSFPERKEGQGLYWWRTELDRRSNIKPK